MMTNKVKNITVTCFMAVILFGLAFWTWFKPADDFSTSERRPLDQFPELSWNTIFHEDSEKTFMKTFESYTLDQFPLRDTFRTLKSIASFYVFGNKDNNNIYIEDGYAAQLEYPIKEDSLDYAAGKFKEAAKYFGANANMYFSIVPDKGYFLAEQNGYLSMDYEQFFSLMADKMDFAEYIDITGELALEDYYKTDTHWRQEKILDVAKKLAEGMGVTLVSEYTEKTLDNPFYGVYYGQSALPLPAEDMKYLTNDILENCTVYSYEDGKNIDVYDMEKAYGKDPYEMYLSGNLTAVKITNPNAITDKELVIFRDSFGASLSPLLIEAYSEIIILDIRYASIAVINSYRDNNGRAMALDLRTADDVLFIYSSLVLNNSSTLR
ncbi:MAG: hypothetical protein IJ489_06805 [Clostridia bacterium]|nr:hypothetical protein [Clostridia bacterium]